MNGSLDGPVFETIAGRGPDLCLREHCPLHGLWAIAMISNALLHEDFLVVVRRSLSQQHTLRYWERGYREYCPEEMELTKAHGPGLGDRPQALMTITTSRDGAEMDRVERARGLSMNVRFAPKPVTHELISVFGKSYQ